MNTALGLIAVGLAASLSSQTVMAAGPWPAFPLEEVVDGNAKRIEFQPLASAEKKWKLCVLLPHMKDSYWSAVNYGVVDEVRRLGLDATVLQAGGYDALPRQVSQYDDCMASGSDAILVAAISEAGLANKFKASMDKGIPTIAFVNAIREIPVTSKIFIDTRTKGRQAGEFFKNKYPAGLNVVAFPGPQGSGWAESYMGGFEEGVKGGKITILDRKYGEAGVPDQLRLVEDALQTYPNMQAIWGTAPTAEAAIGAVADAGLSGIAIASAYENQAMLSALQNKKITGFGVEFPVMQGRIAVNIAVQALQKQKYGKHYMVIPSMVTSETIGQMDTTQFLAPANWQPVFSVK